jgi:hypothetical protein
MIWPRLGAATFDYPELSPAFGRRRCWLRRGRPERSVNQFTKRPNMISQTECRGRRRLMLRTLYAASKSGIALAVGPASVIDSAADGHVTYAPIGF